MIRLALVLLALTQVVHAIPNGSTVCSDATGSLKYSRFSRISGIAPSDALGQYDEELNINKKEYILSKFMHPKEDFVTNLNIEWVETGITLGSPVTKALRNGTSTTTQTLKKLNVTRTDRPVFLYSGHVICEVVTRKFTHLPPSIRPGRR